MMKERWWKSGWFWGGAAPLLPAGAFGLALLAGMKQSEMTIFVVLAALPIAGFLSLTIAVLAAGFLREVIDGIGAAHRRRTP